MAAMISYILGCILGTLTTLFKKYLNYFALISFFGIIFVLFYGTIQMCKKAEKNAKKPFIGKQTIAISDDLINEIVKLEGFEAKAYKCPAGKWTIGSGIRIRDKNGNFVSSAVKFNALPIKYINKIENKKLIVQLFFTEYMPVLHKKIKVSLSKRQKKAVLLLTYNIGTIPNTLADAINKDPNNIVAISKEWKKYTYVGKKPMLTNRRNHELKIYSNNNYIVAR